MVDNDLSSFIIRHLTWSVWTLESIRDMFLSNILSLYRSPKTKVSFPRDYTVIVDF